MLGRRSVSAKGFRGIVTQGSDYPFSSFIIRSKITDGPDQCVDRQLDLVLNLQDAHTLYEVLKKELKK